MTMTKSGTNSVPLSSIALLAIIAGLSFAMTNQAVADPAINLKATDINSDGVVDRSEYQHRMTDRYFLLDADRDGTLTLPEVRAAGAAAFADADTNGNQSLSLAEYLASRLLDFEAADTNSDGKLSLDEVRAWSAERGINAS